MKVVMPKNKSVDLIVLIDRSGSMSNISKDMSGGLNKFIEEQKKLDGVCRVTLADFDSQELRFLNIADDIQKVEPYNLIPRAGTPLFDAITNTFAKYEEYAKDKMDSRICMIITDGEENCSSEVKDPNIIRTFLKNKQEKEGWEIIYLGADHDAFSAAHSMGVASAANYNKTSMSVDNMYGTLHNKMSGVRKGTVRSASLSQDDVDAIVSQDSVKWEK